jgi:hypothetical protein
MRPAAGRSRLRNIPSADNQCSRSSGQLTSSSRRKEAVIMLSNAVRAIHFFPPRCAHSDAASTNFFELGKLFLTGKSNSESVCRNSSCPSNDQAFFGLSSEVSRYAVSRSSELAVWNWLCKSVPRRLALIGCAGQKTSPKSLSDTSTTVANTYCAALDPIR